MASTASCLIRNSWLHFNVHNIFIKKNKETKFQMIEMNQKEEKKSFDLSFSYFLNESLSFSFT
jgi:hypothetical protein